MFTGKDFELLSAANMQVHKPFAGRMYVVQDICKPASPHRTVGCHVWMYILYIRPTTHCPKLEQVSCPKYEGDMNNILFSCQK